MRTATLCGLLLVLGTPSAVAATIEVSPRSAAVDVGGTVTLEILVTDVTDLFSFQFDLAFDPAVLQANGITEGGFLPSGGATFFIPGTIDNTAGLISFTADTLIGAIPGVSGDGTLAAVEFQALTVGSSAISLTNHLLLDSSLGVIGATPLNGSVSAVPEPTAILAFGSGFGALVFLTRRKGPRSRTERSF